MTKQVFFEHSVGHVGHVCGIDQADRLWVMCHVAMLIYICLVALRSGHRTEVGMVGHRWKRSSLFSIVSMHLPDAVGLLLVFLLGFSAFFKPKECNSG